MNRRTKDLTSQRTEAPNRRGSFRPGQVIRVNNHAPYAFIVSFHFLFVCLAGDPYGEASGLLGIPHGHAASHGAGLQGGGAGAGGRGVCHLPRPPEEEGARRAGERGVLMCFNAYFSVAV